MSMLGSSNNNDVEAANKIRLQETVEQNKTALAQQKLNLEKNKFNADMYNAAADRQIKREQMANQLKIARTNKNKYDK